MRQIPTRITSTTMLEKVFSTPELTATAMVFPCRWK